MSKKNKDRRPSVAIVGGGIAGLTAAYRLAAQGFAVTVFEQSDRVGGKIHTSDQQRAARRFEFGAEYINSDDKKLIVLCDELGVPLQPTTQDDQQNAQDYAYFFNGEHYSNAQVKEWYKKFYKEVSPLIHAMESDKVLYKKIDAMPLEDFFSQMAEKGVDSRLIDIFKVAYTHENGNTPQFQSTLSFLNYINTKSADFSLLGVDDEAYWVKGGTESITNALYQRCTQMGVGFRLGANVLRADQGDDGKVIIKCDDCAQEEGQHFDHIIFATSLPMLNRIHGLKNVGFDEELLLTLGNIQHTNVIKIGFPLKGDPRIGTPLDNVASFVSDKSFQMCWHVTGNTSLPESDPAHDSMLVVLAGGMNKQTNIMQLIEQCKNDYAQLLGKSPHDVFKPVEPEFTLSFGRANGCYVSPAPNEFRALEKLSHRQPEGPASLIGGHVTIETKGGGVKMGFMECAVASANKVAKQLGKAYKNQLAAASGYKETHPRINTAAGANELAL